VITISTIDPDWDDLNKLAERTIELGLAIQGIPAPTFHESERAKFVASAFAECALSQIDSDDLHNVYGLIPGVDSSHALLITAHTDTVFEAHTPLTPRVLDNGTIIAPGLGDNSIGVAALISMAQMLTQQSITPPCDLWLVATTREEGMGDLGGMRAAFTRLRDRIGAVVNIEGLALGHVYNAGIAVRRLRITTQTDGGHSWLHFGQPSAIHALMQLGTRITRLRPPVRPRTTYNIGMVEGGRSVNSIASYAEMLLDLRSEESGALLALEREVRQLVAEERSSGVEIGVEVIGDRPAGRVAPEHALVRAALTSLHALGIHPTLESGSTDGNIPLAAGCPTVTIGITRGGNAHRTDEYIETAPVITGLRHLIALTLEGSAMLAAGELKKDVT
jgi:acetylornithine deacetylase/succinyl-diaminopimelate desuccinylase-like protein